MRMLPSSGSDTFSMSGSFATALWVALYEQGLKDLYTELAILMINAGHDIDTSVEEVTPTHILAFWLPYLESEGVVKKIIKH